MTPVDRIADLEEQVAYLRGELGLLQRADDKLRLSKRWQLTGRESDLLLGLYSRPGVLSKDHLLDLLYTHEQDEPEVKIIDVFVCKLRAKMGREAIETAWGQGYMLSASGRAACQDALSTPVEAVRRADPPLERGRDRTPKGTVVPVALRRLAQGPCSTRDVAAATQRSLAQTGSLLTSAYYRGQVEKFGVIGVPGRRITWGITEIGRRHLATYDQEAQAA